jgi:hypothetical protein
LSLDEQKTSEYKEYERLQAEYEAYVAANGEDSYVVFRPEQIKSVFNAGPFDARSKNILASMKRGPGQVTVSNQAAWIAENRNRMLPEIEVEVSALDEEGKAYKIKEKADVAVRELTRQKNFAERLLECLES